MDQGSDKNWQDLCQAAPTEQDPKKLMMLVAEIIETLDDRNRRPESPVVNRQDRDGRTWLNGLCLPSCQDGAWPESIE